MESKDYWKGYTDAQKQSERNYNRKLSETHEQFMEVVEGAREIKGIGAVTHERLITHTFDGLLMVKNRTESEVISNRERSRITKELANTKWSKLTNDQLVAIQNILMGGKA